MAFRSMRLQPAGDEAKASRRPASILLDQRVHISNSINQLETTLVTAESRDGHAINLSLRIHEPPALSFFCLRCHKVPDSDSDAEFQDWAEVVGAEGRFVLLRATRSPRSEPLMESKSVDTFDSPGSDARRPASILLHDLAHFADFRIDHPPDITDNCNETTATAKSIGGHTMAVSFWIANPPDMSFFSIVCSDPPDSNSKGSYFRIHPHVVGAEGRFVLLRARFFFYRSPDEYFMYKASDDEPPSLERVPPPTEADDALRTVREFGVVPCGNDGHYLLVALCDAHDAPMDYKLHIYSSEKKAWSSTTLPNPCPEVKRIVPEKVITIGEGVLGWVDLSCGLLVCNLSQDQPDAHFIPFPEPMPENRDKLRASPTSVHSARLFRDVTCINGVLKFVEMEHRMIEIAPEKPSDPSDKDLLYDSDLILSLKRKNMDEKPKQTRLRYGWRAVMWTRMILSNCWRKGCTVDVADILVDKSTESGVKAKTSGELMFWDLYSTFPTFTMDGGDILYLKSTTEPKDYNGWVFAVDLGNKTVKALGAFSLHDYGPSEQAFRPCTLSRYLNMTPGIKVSAFKVTQTGSSANGPNNEPTSCKWRSKLQRQSAKEVDRAQSKAQIVVQNDHISVARPHPIEDYNVESTIKLRRMILAGKYVRPKKKYPSVKQNDHVSCAPPVQNILPPQESFNKWDWSHQNNQDGPFYPRYAPMSLAHGYGNYQPQWKQPASFQQQQMPISYHGPQEVSSGQSPLVQACFSKQDGAGYHGDSQRPPSHYSYSYGTQTDYGNDQPQWQQHRPEHASSSWQQPPPVVHGGVWIS